MRLFFAPAVGLTLVCLPSAVPAESTQPDDLKLDWSEWSDPPVAPLADNLATSMDEVLATPCVDDTQTSGCHQLLPAQVRRLVHDCARRLKVAGDPCGNFETPVVEDGYRLPHMESGGLPCGFEVTVYSACGYRHDLKKYHCKDQQQLSSTAAQGQAAQSSVSRMLLTMAAATLTHRTAVAALRPSVGASTTRMSFFVQHKMRHFLYKNAPQRSYHIDYQVP